MGSGGRLFGGEDGGLRAQGLGLLDGLVQNRTLNPKPKIMCLWGSKDYESISGNPRWGCYG